MTDVLAISLHSMQQDMARLERISLNMANAMTPGYKREVATALPLAAGGFVDAMNTIGASQPEPQAGAPSAAGMLMIQTDARPGTLKSTGQNLDVALTGSGYFEVSTEAGMAYTRQGSWHLDGRGRLVTAQGHPVMGQGGEIVLSHPNPRIDASGQVFEAKTDGRADPVPVAQLKVVQFDNVKDLQRMGDGLVRTDQPPTQVAATDVQLRQGFLENSNVNSMQEMVQLIQSMRHFEAMQKVALGYDDMIGTAVRKLGELS
jgi:flagellar basal-body rod protein FlgF